jgi:hypothetical protein
MEYVEFIVGHGVDNLLDDWNADEITRRVDDKTTVNKGWRVGYVGSRQHNHRFQTIVPGHNLR